MDKEYKEGGVLIPGPSLIGELGKHCGHQQGPLWGCQHLDPNLASLGLYSVL